MKTAEVNGIVYEKIPEPIVESGSYKCFGCAFDFEKKPYVNCLASPDCAGIIFVKINKGDPSCEL